MSKNSDVLFDELIEKRGELRTKLARLRKKITELKKARDDKNRVVVDLKKKRNEASSRLIEVKRKLSRLNSLVQSAPEKPYAVLKREYDRLDWDCQTEVMGRKAEERIVKRLDELEAQLKKAKAFSKHRKEYTELIRQLKELRQESKTQHELVLQNAAESEAFHRELVKLYDSADSVKADLERLEQRLREEFPSQVPRPRQERRDNREMKEKAKSIMEGFKKGKKLTMDDLAILQEHGL